MALPVIKIEERHLIEILSGRVGSQASPEFFNTPIPAYTPHDVKALFFKISKKPADLRKIMSHPQWGRTFETNVNIALVECAKIERAAAAKEAKSKK
jgi:hypothetical protein